MIQQNCFQIYNQQNFKSLSKIVLFVQAEDKIKCKNAFSVQWFTNNRGIQGRAFESIAIYALKSASERYERPSV